MSSPKEIRGCFFHASDNLTLWEKRTWHDYFTKREEIEIANRLMMIISTRTRFINYALFRNKITWHKTYCQRCIVIFYSWSKSDFRVDPPRINSCIKVPLFTTVDFLLFMSFEQNKLTLHTSTWFYEFQIKHFPGKF